MTNVSKLAVELSTQEYQDACLEELFATAKPMKKVSLKKEEEILDDLAAIIEAEYAEGIGTNFDVDERYFDNDAEWLDEQYNSDPYEDCYATRFFGEDDCISQFSGRRKRRIDCDSMYYNG